MRKRLRKKRHREYLTTVCAFAVTFDDELRDRLLQSEPGTPFRIDGACRPWMKRLIDGNRLRYWTTMIRKHNPATAIVTYWAEEFPSVRDEAVLFSMANVGAGDRIPEGLQK